MVRPSTRTYRPKAANKLIYDQLYAEYGRLHDCFGRAANSPMKVLRRLRAAAFADK